MQRKVPPINTNLNNADASIKHSYRQNIPLVPNQLVHEINMEMSRGMGMKMNIPSISGPRLQSMDMEVKINKLIQQKYKFIADAQKD